jgi:hypothetical protein
MDPSKGTVKIQTIGPVKEGTSKKGNPYRVFQLQFVGDPQWYNTFWLGKEDPKEGAELIGEKSYDDQFKSWNFNMDNPNGKSSWNPASAQATVMLGAVELVSGFLAIPKYQAMWENNDPLMKPIFDKYLATVEVVSKRLKEAVVGMGSLQAETKTGARTSPGNDGDPGPTPPPDVDSWPDGETAVDV